MRGRGLRPEAITAGGDLHPALKMNDSVVCLHYTQNLRKGKRYFLYKIEYLFYNNLINSTEGKG